MAGSAALLASQINGGGCLAPPTPKERPSDALAKTLDAFFGDKSGQTKFDKYKDELPPSLAYRASTRKGMVEGLGAFIDETNMSWPEDPTSMGVRMKEARVQRLDRPRRDGDPLQFQTSYQRQFEYLQTVDKETLKLFGAG